MEKICQSCGMNMITNEDFGTNTDGTPNEEYCQYCYQEGKFTQELTMEEQAEINLQFLDEYNEEEETTHSIEEAREELLKYLPTLKRWKK